MVTCSSGSTPFSPPRALWMMALPWMSWRISSGSMDRNTSGPGQLLSEVKCRSSMEAPSAAAPRQG
jgi:hypothetical protein